MSASGRAALFGVRHAVIGMVHLQPLPRTQRAAQILDEITARAV